MARFFLSFLSLLSLTTTAFHINPSRTRQPSTLLSSTDDANAKLIAAAKKLREEAAELEISLGKTPSSAASTSSTSKDMNWNWSPTTSAASVKQSLPLNDPIKQTEFLTTQTDVFNSLPPNKLMDFPLPLAQLALRTSNLLSGDALGVSGADDVSLDDFKDATILVVVVSSILALASGLVIGGNAGATGMYLFALLPIGWISIGSTAPGILAGLIETTKGTKESKEAQRERIVAHESAHFLCGYVCGLPVRGASVVGSAGGDNNVEFYTSQKGDVGGEFAEMDVNRLAVTAMSGAVGECLTLGSARGIKGDLAVLEDVFRRSEKFIGEARRQDMTRWSGLTAYDILKSHEKEYEALKGVFGKEGTTVEDCVCCIEENRTRRDFEEDRA